MTDGPWERPHAARRPGGVSFIDVLLYMFAVYAAVLPIGFGVAIPFLVLDRRYAEAVVTLICAMGGAGVATVIWLVARARRDCVSWSNKAAFAIFLVAAVLSCVALCLLARAPNPDGTDGNGYAAMGCVTLAGIALLGGLLLVRDVIATRRGRASQ